MFEIINNRLYGIKFFILTCFIVVHSFNLEIEVHNNNQDNNINFMNPFDNNPVFDTISQLMFSKFL